MAFAVATKVKGGIRTSSPSFTPTKCKANLNATVPLVTAIAYFAPVYSHMLFSNFSTHSPVELTQLLSIQSLTYFNAFVTSKFG